MGECGAREEGVIASWGVESGWMQTHLLREGAARVIAQEAARRERVRAAGESELGERESEIDREREREQR